MTMQPPHLKQPGGRMNHIVEVTVTYTRQKVSRGEWWGDTIPRTRSHLWHFAASLPKNIAADIRRIKRHHVQAWIDNNPAHSPAHRRVKLVAVRGLFRWLHEDGRIRLNPTVGVVSGAIPETAPRAFSDEDVEALFTVAQRDPRELLCVSLAWNEGLRRSEIGLMLIDDLNERAATVGVRGKYGRGKITRTAAVSRETMRAIHAYLQSEPPAYSGSGPLVRSRRLGQGHAPLSSGGIYQIIAPIIRDAGLKRFPWDGRSPHAGRHTAATQGVEAGVPSPIMMRQFGWKNEAMLRRYSSGAALDLHPFHQLRDARREVLGGNTIA